MQIIIKLQISATGFVYYPKSSVGRIIISSFSKMLQLYCLKSTSSVKPTWRVRFTAGTDRI